MNTLPAHPLDDDEPGRSAAPVYRKGLALKDEVAGELAADYHSVLVDEVRATDYQWQQGRLRIHLAREFGFCYGVDRAVDYAYQTRRRFPHRSIYLTGEIIHNPRVNERLREAGIRFLSDPEEDEHRLGAEDVVILPAFGVTIAILLQLQGQGCTLVDTTCGSVLNVWKNVLQYARDGFTAIIHGKVKHEETQATASQVLRYAHGRSLVVLDRAEASVICDFIRHGGTSESFLGQFGHAVSPGFDPVRDLQRVGLANQTTMLMSESLVIGEMIREAMVDRYGQEPGELAKHYRAFDTICSATQDRQDAVAALLKRQDLDLMIVIGGYNSSNTRNLARLAGQQLATYHIADAECLVSPREIQHRPVDHAPPSAVGMMVPEIRSHDWLPHAGAVKLGLTAGASTPDSVVGQVIERLGTFVADHA
ncbi:MAG: 4-hydroxy-3-methylbut-2-enyl diphosphate reductase [Acidobacteriota bacterium]|nr:4-hydroxy-3-methylbut-2-enyl diphosphate reductase [Acidobacteriota bacterium]